MVLIRGVTLRSESRCDSEIGVEVQRGVTLRSELRCLGVILRLGFEVPRGGSEI